MFHPTARRSRKSHSHCVLHSSLGRENSRGRSDVRTFRRLDATKSFPLISFADPHPLILLESYRFKNRGRGPLRSFNISIRLSTFRMNTFKSVSKQRTLSSFRMNSFEKQGRGWPVIVNQESSWSAGARSRFSYKPRSPFRPIAAHSLWCHNPQRHQISLPHRETSPLSPVSKDTRADNGDSSILVLLASRAWVQRSNVEPAAGWLAFQQAGRKGRQCPIGLVPCHGAAMKPNSSTSSKRARRRPSTGSSRTIMRRSIT